MTKNSLESSQLQEKFGAKKKELFLVFVDLEKDFDHVPRVATQWALRSKKVPEHLIPLVMALWYLQQVLQLSLG